MSNQEFNQGKVVQEIPIYKEGISHWRSVVATLRERAGLEEETLSTWNVAPALSCVVG